MQTKLCISPNLSGTLETIDARTTTGAADSADLHIQIFSNVCIFHAIHIHSVIYLAQGEGSVSSHLGCINTTEIFSGSMDPFHGNTQISGHGSTARSLDHTTVFRDHHIAEPDIQIFSIHGPRCSIYRCTGHGVHRHMVILADSQSGSADNRSGKIQIGSLKIHRSRGSIVVSHVQICAGTVFERDRHILCAATIYAVHGTCKPAVFYQKFCLLVNGRTSYQILCPVTEAHIADYDLRSAIDLAAAGRYLQGT